MGSWGEDGADAEPNGAGVWEVTRQPGQRRGDRSLIHPPSPLPSRAREREEYRVASGLWFLPMALCTWV